jgi:hypothetical protein
MSDHSDVEEFETADAGASTTVPMQAGSVRKGGFMVIKGRPTKVRLRRNAEIPRHGNRASAGVSPCAGGRVPPSDPPALAQHVGTRPSHRRQT